MARTAQRRSRRRRANRPQRGLVWLRAVLHPLVLVGPPVLLCFLIAYGEDSNDGDIGWGLLVIPACAMASLVTTVVMVASRPLPTLERVAVLILGLAASGAALVFGLIAWVHAAGVACHGTYECPF